MLIYKFCQIGPSNIENKKKLGRIYIGQCKNLKKRIQKYKDEIKKGASTYIERSLDKYGWNNFSLEIIDEAGNQDELDQKEKYWIKYFRSNLREFGFNQTEGGTSGFKVTKESINRRIETWDKMIENGYVSPNRGKKRTEEQKQKYSIVQKELSKRENYINPFKGKHHSEETKQKMSELKRGKTTWIKGVGHSDETCKKMVKNSAWRKPILCIEDNKIYSSIGQTAIAENCSDTSIGEVCRGQTEHFRGKHYKFITKEEELQFNNNNNQICVTT